MYDFDTGHFTSEIYADLLRLAGRTGLDAHRKKYKRATQETSAAACPSVMKKYLNIISWS